MDQHSWQVICALAGVIQLLTGGIIRYLLKEIDKLERRIEAMNGSAQTVNDTNARLASQIPDLLSRIGERR